MFLCSFRANVGKFGGNLGENCAWSVLWFKKCPQHERKCSVFFGGHFLWSFFLAGLGKFGLKSSAPRKFACFHTYGSGITPSLPVIKKPLWKLKTLLNNPNFLIAAFAYNWVNVELTLFFFLSAASHFKLLTYCSSNSIVSSHIVYLCLTGKTTGAI